MHLLMDQQGWVSGAQHIKSPNYNVRPQGSPINLLIIHSISLPPGKFGGDAITQLFLNQLDYSAHPYYATLIGLEVSSHFLIRRDGSLIQYVSCLDRAWHAGQSSWRNRANCNDYSIGVELEGTDDSAFTEKQYATLQFLIELLKQHYPISDIVGHEDVAPGRKTDPGPYFDWQRVSHFTEDNASPS
ncbi:MAG: 1,6-anhydro-N-acetylmuramyl-L-alanine amidase AmpD [Betaproteobacteria bacterium]|nr:1,6-anhydro-N-acetylmuramyl-L-alanine amidase AmpD [Betaproteobacteria bacterium]